jgi:hypothetical protein
LFFFYYFIFIFFYFFQSQVSCGDIATDAECTGPSAVTGTNYDGKCGVYDGVCKLKCEEITGDDGDDICNNTRSSDCFLILANESNGVYLNTCANKV